MKLSIEDILGSALRPSTWLAWIPQDILDHLVYDVRLMISNINGLWIITNEELDVIWSSEPVEIEKPVNYKASSASEAMKLVMAAVSPNPDFEPDDVG